MRLHHILKAIDKEHKTVDKDTRPTMHRYTERTTIKN